MSTTRTGPASASAGGRDAVAPAKESQPSSSPVRTSAWTPVTSMAASQELLDVVGITGGRGGHQSGPGDTVGVHQCSVLAQHRERPTDRLLRKAACRVDSLARGA